MKATQFVHKIIAVSLIKKALRQTEKTQRAAAWENATRYSIDNITCPKFLNWVDSHSKKCDGWH